MTDELERLLGERGQSVNLLSFANADGEASLVLSVSRDDGSGIGSVELSHQKARALIHRLESALGFHVKQNSN